jgi:hypothetical protein
MKLLKNMVGDEVGMMNPCVYRVKDFSNINGGYVVIGD